MSLATRSFLPLLAAFALLLGGCGGSDGDNHLGPGNAPLDLSNLEVFEQTSPYRDVLLPCVTASSSAASCSMTTVPLLGQERDEPSIADVMDRVAVSHPWMGERFRDLLETLPPDILILLKGITAVVIDADIRPSFYSSLTGAIYLDPAHLWLTNEEKTTISRRPDFRSDFGSDLHFVSLWRYVRDNEYAYPFFSLSGSETRRIDDIRFRVAALLYHELAHANDYFPPDRIATLDRSRSIIQAATALRGSRISDRLSGESPLISSIWKALASVLFRGEVVTPDQRGYSADFVGLRFEEDGANDDYGYASPFEDVAMLFEEVMMKHHFGIDRDIAYTPVPAQETPVCDDYLVKWGNRNRIAHPHVRERARRVVADILPGEDFSALFDALTAEVPMRNDEGWCGNLSPTTVHLLRVRPPDETLDLRIFEDMRPPHGR